MITDKEKELLETVNLESGDFYVTFIALALARYDAATLGGKRGLPYNEISGIVTGVNQDLVQYLGSDLNDFL